MLHLAGIIAGHIYYYIIVLQLNVSHILPAVYSAVEHLHHLTRIKSMALAEVDAQRRHVLVVILALLPSALLLTFVLALRCHLFYFRRIGVVFHEASKLTGHNLLYQLILVDVLKIAVDVLHERLYLLIVNVGLHYLVHHLVELFLADLSR